MWFHSYHWDRLGVELWLLSIPFSDITVYSWGRGNRWEHGLGHSCWLICEARLVTVWKRAVRVTHLQSCEFCSCKMEGRAHSTAAIRLTSVFSGLFGCFCLLVCLFVVCCCCFCKEGHALGKKCLSISGWKVVSVFRPGCLLKGPYQLRVQIIRCFWICYNLWNSIWYGIKLAIQYHIKYTALGLNWCLHF